MNLKRILLFMVAITVIFVLIDLYMRNHMNQRIHVLTQPLMMDGSAEAGHNYLLPAGTTLYFDKAFPEGFISYRIYVNVEGIDLPSEILADPTEIRPISAYPVDKSALIKLLKEYPITKNELAAILKSSYLSKEEIRELLKEYSN
jgi:hypothetical protein